MEKIRSYLDVSHTSPPLQHSRHAIVLPHYSQQWELWFCVTSEKFATVYAGASVVWLVAANNQATP
jgi:hypothetical protein